MANEKMTQRPENKKENDSITSKISEKFDQFKEGDKIDQIYQFAKTNTRDTIAYLVLFFGVLLSLFKPLYGGLLIGIIFGVYFADDILSLIQKCNQSIEKQGIIRSLILGGALLGFFIAAPAIFIGIAITIGIKHMLTSK